MTDNVAVIRQFVAAWPRLNPTELASYFSEDGVYHNMPSGPVSGRANIERFIAGVGSSRVDLQACKLEYSIVSPK